MGRPLPVLPKLPEVEAEARVIRWFTQAEVHSNHGKCRRGSVANLIKRSNHYRRASTIRKYISACWIRQTSEYHTVLFSVTDSHLAQYDLGSRLAFL